MALLFSAVTLTGDDDQVELLVPGIPRESIDLRGWTAYESFIASIDHEQEIRVHVAACLYGEGQPFLASPEEIAYFTLRAKEDDSFLCDHCSHAGHSDFQFTWSPEMSYGKETNGCFLKDGEKAYYNRDEILGVLKEEFLPEWASEKLDELENTAEESAGMTMGGM